ncbi:MAG: GNAT family N-acetyltransferase [Paracoccaceae bacterium]
MTSLTIAPLTPDHTEDFITLFGPSGACYGCWCTYFRLPPKLRAEFTAQERKSVMLRRIAEGPPPGLMGWLDAEPVAWMQIGPRSDVPQWNNPRRATTPLPDAPADDPAVWAISCFFIRNRTRGLGLSHQMVRAGIDFARENGARVLEAAPMDQAKQSKSIGLFVGSTSVFRAAGFSEVARQKPGRPLMRLVL